MSAKITLLSSFFFNKLSNKKKEPVASLRNNRFFVLRLKNVSNLSFLSICYLWLMTRGRRQHYRESCGFFFFFLSQKQVCTDRTVGWLAADKQTDKLPPCKNIPVSTLNLTYKNNNNKKSYKNQSLFKSPLRKDESTTKEL